MPDQEGEIILSGSIEEVKSALTTMKGIQQMLGWYGLESGNSLPDRISPVKRSAKPHITLYFLEKRPKGAQLSEAQKAIYRKSRPKDGEISLRIMNMKSPTRHQENLITKDMLLPYAERIKAKFATPPFVWKKGKTMYSYSDWDNGIQFQLLCISENEARRVIEQALDIIQLSPEWRYLNIITTPNVESRYPDTSDSITIADEKFNFAKERPIVDVTFRHACIVFPTVSAKRVLYDLSGKLRNPILPRS
jgi:hypothetical protein